MLKTKFKNAFKRLKQNLHKIPDAFWVRTAGNQHEVIWFLDRQSPSIEQSYDFEEERFGMTRDGQLIWGFDSGCS